MADGRPEDGTYAEGVPRSRWRQDSVRPPRVLSTSHQIVVAIPADVFETSDLATAAYQESIDSDADGGKGIGQVRRAASGRRTSETTMPPHRRQGGTRGR